MHTLLWILRFLTRSPQSGQDMVEYALVVALLAIVSVGTIIAVGSSIGGVLGLWTWIAAQLP